MRLVNIGYGNAVVADRVVAVISPDSAPMKRFKDEARKAGRLIDGTQGRRTRSILITDSHHIVLSALQTETLAERLERGGSNLPPLREVQMPPAPVDDAAAASDGDGDGDGDSERAALEDDEDAEDRDVPGEDEEEPGA